MKTFFMIRYSDYWLRQSSHYIQGTSMLNKIVLIGGSNIGGVLMQE
jgi:hypothetical protein